MFNSDLPTHLKKLIKYFLKCRGFGINLNPQKCAFMVFSRTILRFIVTKVGETPYLKKLNLHEHANSYHTKRYISF
jgi:hypothetical protein